MTEMTEEKSNEIKDTGNSSGSSSGSIRRSGSETRIEEDIIGEQVAGKEGEKQAAAMPQESGSGSGRELK